MRKIRLCPVAVHQPSFDEGRIKVIRRLHHIEVGFGAILVLNLKMATILPPFGLSRFVIKGTASAGTTLNDIYRAALSFVRLNLTVMAAMIAFPHIVPWLPQLMD